jgi:gluconate kinase
MLRNLAALCANFASAGVTRLVLAEAVETAAFRDRLREATGASTLVVCRLRAGLETMRQRVRLREPGILQAQFVARVAELETALDNASTEDFTVDNDQRPITEAAREMLARAGWL